MLREIKRIRRMLLVPIEWIGIAVAFCVIPWLSRRVLWGCCDFLSAVMYRFDRRGKRRALENLHILLGRATVIEGTKAYNPDRAVYCPTAREEKIIRRSYRNMARAVGYAFWTIFGARRKCAEAGVVSARVKEFLAANRPAVTVSGHIGCWEILSQLAFLEGHRMMSVAKDIGTGGMTALLMAARRSIGQEIVPADGAFKPLMQGLKDGKSLGLLVDQHVSPRKGGIWIRIFGKPMPVSAAPAFFAAKVRVPVIVAWSRPLKDGRYLCDFIRTYDVEQARDIWGLTQSIASDLERVIRRHPSCWVLNYNYFKQMPTEDELNALSARESKQR